MKSYKVDFSETGFVKIDGDVETIVAHYRDGRKETMPIFQFLTLKKKNDIIQIDCYKKGEKL